MLSDDIIEECRILSCSATEFVLDFITPGEPIALICDSKETYVTVVRELRRLLGEPSYRVSLHKFRYSFRGNYTSIYLLPFNERVLDLMEEDSGSWDSEWAKAPKYYVGDNRVGSLSSRPHELTNFGKAQTIFVGPTYWLPPQLEEVDIRAHE